MSNLYIGLGGVGIDAVKAVYERNHLNGDCCYKDKYLSIDTDAHSKQNLPWISLSDGSDIQRLSSALCELESRLATDELLHVFVFTGSCDGTGSAIALDILYMIRTIMMSGAIHNVEKCNDISLLVAMPQLWISQAGRDYDSYDPNLEYKLTANAVAFFAELQSAIDNSDEVPFNCCCVFESNRMTKEQVSKNMAEVASALSRVDDPDFYWGLNKSMSVVSCHHLQEEFLSVAAIRRCSEIVDMDLTVDHLERVKVCYMVRPDFRIPVDVLNLMNENIIGLRTNGQKGIDVLSFHSFAFKDYAFYNQYMARSDGRWAFVDKR